MDPEIYRMLYADETGEIVGLDEVQYLRNEDELAVRVPALREVLEGSDVGAALDSLLVLCAWGDDVAIDKAYEAITAEENSFEGVNTHRLHGADRTYDLVANSLSMGVKLRGVDPDRVVPHAEGLLRVGTEVFFESGLERLISAIGKKELFAPTEHLMTTLIEMGDMRRASDLLPAFAAMDKEAAWGIIVSFRNAGYYANETYDPVVTALGRIRTDEAFEELERIRHSGFRGASDSVDFALRNGL